MREPVSNPFRSPWPLVLLAVSVASTATAEHDQQTAGSAVWWVHGFTDANVLEQSMNLTPAVGETRQTQACTTCDPDRPVTYTFRSDEVFPDGFPLRSSTTAFFQVWIGPHQAPGGGFVAPGNVIVDFRLEAAGRLVGTARVTQGVTYSPVQFAGIFTPQTSTVSGQLVWTVTISGTGGTFNPGAALYGSSHEYPLRVRLPVPDQQNPAYQIRFAQAGDPSTDLVVGQNRTVPITITNTGRQPVEVHVEPPHADPGLRVAWVAEPGQAPGTGVRLKPGQALWQNLTIEPRVEGQRGITLSARHDRQVRMDFDLRVNVAYPNPGPGATDSYPDTDCPVDPDLLDGRENGTTAWSPLLARRYEAPTRTMFECTTRNEATAGNLRVEARFDPPPSGETQWGDVEISVWHGTRGIFVDRFNTSSGRTLWLSPAPVGAWRFELQPTNFLGSVVASFQPADGASTASNPSAGPSADAAPAGGDPTTGDDPRVLTPERATQFVAGLAFVVLAIVILIVFTLRLR